MFYKLLFFSNCICSQKPTTKSSVASNAFFAFLLCFGQIQKKGMGDNGGRCQSEIVMEMVRLIVTYGKVLAKT